MVPLLNGVACALKKDRLDQQQPDIGREKTSMRIATKNTGLLWRYTAMARAPMAQAENGSTTPFERPDMGGLRGLHGVRQLDLCIKDQIDYSCRLIRRLINETTARYDRSPDLSRYWSCRSQRGPRRHPVFRSKASFAMGKHRSQPARQAIAEDLLT